MSLIKVNKNKNPYHIIGEYIEKHITYVDDIIAVISLDGNIINELFLVEITTESNFIWQNDWWEGEENVELIDFFFVSDACKRYDDNNDSISRQTAIDYFVTNVGFHDEDGYPIEDECELREIWTGYFDDIPSVEPKRIIGKWVGADTQCGIACSVCGVAVDDFCYSADYMDLDYEPNFCPNCGAKMEVTE